MRQITIIGLGLVGTSLGMAWRQMKGGWEVVGHDISREASQRARKMGAVDRTEWNLPASAEKADLVVLAIPVNAIEHTLGHIADCLPPHCVVTDTGSTKSVVLALADRLLPPGVSFIGGNPIVDISSSTRTAAADLFVGRPYCLIPSAKATAEAIDTVCQLVEALGAEPYFLNPAEHDGLIGAAEQLPLAISAALLRATAGTSSGRELRRLAGSSFRSVAEVALGDAGANAALCETNRVNLVRWLDTYLAELTRFRDLIQDESQGLESFFNEVKTSTERLTVGEDQEVETTLDMPSVGTQMRRSFFGSGRLLRREKGKGPGSKS